MKYNLIIFWNGMSIHFFMNDEHIIHHLSLVCIYIIHIAQQFTLLDSLKERLVKIVMYCQEACLNQ